MTTITAEESRALLEPLTGYPSGPWMRVGWKPCGIYQAGDVSTAKRIASLDERHEHDDDARLIAATPDLATHLRAALDRETELQVERDAAVEWAEKAEVERDGARAEVERLRGVLAETASQKRTDELVTVLDVEYADFEGGYDECVNRARAALAQESGQ